MTQLVVEIVSMVQEVMLMTSFLEVEGSSHTVSKFLQFKISFHSTFRTNEKQREFLYKLNFICANRRTSEQTNRQTDKQTNRQTDKPTKYQNLFGVVKTSRSAGRAGPRGKNIYTHSWRIQCM